ncbi:MAG: elongation factor Ts, partial [Deltaproteobacteria bacterium]|nr:elongation factor Ts [Deltaproteobacteria bacterium]
KESGKPEKVIEKIAEGKLDKFYKDNCLLEQQFVKNNDQTIGDLLTEAIAKLGENMQINRFTRYAIGEGSDENSTEECA